MKPQGSVGRAEHSQDGNGASDALVRLRRQSDWTREERAGDEAAEAAYRAALAMATATLAAYDGNTASHSDDVVTLTIALAEQMGIEGRDRAYLLAAAELHDIGKVAVAPVILSKPSALEPHEWDVVREHTVTGERILGSVPELREVARIVRNCHERWDGQGYPDGLRGQQIPLAARVVFCADAFHAIRGDRPYRRGRSAAAALAEVEKHSGTQFDPAVVAALRRVAAQLRERRRLGLVPMLSGSRSQRLAALLLTLVVGGSAFAATGLWRPSGGEASDEPAQATPAPSSSGPAPVSGEPATRPPKAPERQAAKGEAASGGAAAKGVATQPEEVLEPGGRGPASGPGPAAPDRAASREPAEQRAPRRRTAKPSPSPVETEPAPTRSPGKPAPVAPPPAPLPAPSPPSDDGAEDGDDGDEAPEVDDDSPDGKGKGEGNGKGEDNGKGDGKGNGHDGSHGGHGGHGGHG